MTVSSQTRISHMLSNMQNMFTTEFQFNILDGRLVMKWLPAESRTSVHITPLVAKLGCSSLQNIADTNLIRTSGNALIWDGTHTRTDGKCYTIQLGRYSPLRMLFSTNMSVPSALWEGMMMISAVLSTQRVRQCTAAYRPVRAERTMLHTTSQWMWKQQI